MNLRRPLALSIVYLGLSAYAAGVVNCASVSLTDQAFAKDKPKDGPTLQMEVNAPPELEKAVEPYYQCLRRWLGNRRGTLRELRPEMDFENGPVACANERDAFLVAGDAALMKRVTDPGERHKQVHLELVGENIAIFGVLVWMSQFESANS